MSVASPLLTALAPLQTLPGWPEAPTVTLLDNLVWIAAIPVAVSVVVILIHMAAMRGKEDISLHPPTEPIVVTGPQDALTPRGIGVSSRNEALLDRQAAEDDSAEAHAAVESDVARHAVEDEAAGGSSARW